MPVNWVRGFRRIGWLITVPLVVIIVFFFYGRTRVLIPASYDVEWHHLFDAYSPNPSFSPIDPPKPLSALFDEVEKEGMREYEMEYPIDIPGFGRGKFRTDRYESVSTDVVGSVIEDFLAINTPPEPPSGYKLDPWYLVFTVHKQASVFRLAGLIIGAFICVALVIQGSISILAWVLGGFKG